MHSSTLSFPRKIYLTKTAKTAGIFTAGISISEAIHRLDFPNGDSSLTPPANEEPTEETSTGTPTAATPITSVPEANGVQDDMSFSEAFAAARAEVGAPGIFHYQGAYYSTFLESEFTAMSTEERQAYAEAVQEVVNATPSGETSETDQQVAKEEVDHPTTTEAIEDVVTDPATAIVDEVEIATPHPTTNDSIADVPETATPPTLAQQEYLDTDQDGVSETLLQNLDQDNQAEMIFVTDGKNTIAFVDTENDGIIDSLYKVTAEGKLEFYAELDDPFPAPKIQTTTQYRDLQGQDGILDAKLYDTDGDGVANRVDMDIDGDGIYAKAYFDTDGDGRLDKAADLAEDGTLSNVITLNDPFEAPQLSQTAVSREEEIEDYNEEVLAQADVSIPTSYQDDESESDGSIDSEADMADWD